MTGYNLGVLAAHLNGLTAPAANTLQIGDRMQELAAYLLDALPGVTIEKQKSKNLGGSEETDIWMRHWAHLSKLPFPNMLVPVECKNEATPISSSDISRFGTKIAHSGGADGLFIARTKLAGGRAYESGHLAVHDELVAGRRIVVLTAADLATLTTPESLAELIVDRFVELRMSSGYSSI